MTAQPNHDNPERRYEVTPLELFFDLVFVFAVSQLSIHLSTHLSWRGAAETLVMLLAIFAVWFTTSWSATMIRADQSRTRWLVLAVMLLGRQTFSKNNRKERKMKYTAMVISLSLLVSAVAVTGQALTTESSKKSQTISRAGSQPSVKGSAEYFTGNVRIDPLFPANESAPFSGAYVTFEPGARSAWHTHPTGQHLLVTAGVGRTQEWGGPIEEIKAGDVIWCPPKIKHWHGASPTTAMTHIAITGTVNGKNVEWMEKVTDEQYNGK